MLEVYQELSSMLSPFPCLAQDCSSWEALQSYDYSLEKIGDHSNSILKKKKFTCMGNVFILIYLLVKCSRVWA